MNVTQLKRIALLERRLALSVAGAWILAAGSPAPARAHVTPIPGAGTIYPVRVTGEWGSIEAQHVLMSPDGATLTVPGPAQLDGRTIIGDGWTITLAPGWTVRPGVRLGDFQVVRGDP